MAVNAAEIARALNAKKSGDGWIANCVAHDDKNPSLSISDVDGKTLVKCHAGCEQAAVIDHLTERGLWNATDRSRPFDSHPTLGTPSATYDYHDAHGQLVSRVMRFDRPNGKEIRQTSLQDGIWTWKALPAPRPLYRLPELLKSTGPIVLVEGEKAAAAALTIATGMAVTTWAGGAKATKATDFSPLKGRNVILWPDNDEPGRNAMRSIALRLQSIAVSVRLFDPGAVEELPDGWDAADALADQKQDLQATWEAMSNAPIFAESSSHIHEVKPSGPNGSHAAFSWLEEFELSDTEAEQITDPTWVEPGLFVEGHVISVVAKPNGGKTTICFRLGCEIAKRGKNVVYIHADTNPSDAKGMREQAKRHGVRYLTPDMKVGKGMADVIKHLSQLANSDADLTGHVWFFDTLKKMANVINKDSLKATLTLMRKLSSRGMTCVLLCHTNKYRNADGEYQYEGTGDLEADCDELIYFEPQENSDGSLTVSTRCVKRRADIEPMTWDIHRDRTVIRRAAYVDVAAELATRAQREEDQPVIEAISDSLADGPKKQTDVMLYCRELKLTEKRIRTVLKRYSGELWTAEKLFEKNAWRYTLVAGPRTPLPNCRTGGTDFLKVQQ